jgi:putative ABC transport system permease protein
MENPFPSRLFQAGRAVLALAVPRDRRREVEGDLIELWRRRRATGRRDLRRAYVRDLAGLLAARRRLRPIGTTRPGNRLAHPGFAMWQDVRQALRLMRRKPGSTLAAVATLAIGIGAGLAIFTGVDRLLLRPLPFPEPDRLVHVEHGPLRLSRTGSGVSKSFIDLPAIAAAGIWAAGGLNLDGGGDGIRLTAAAVDDGFFATMGVAPLIGQPLPTPDGTSRHAVLSYDLWRTRFNADRAMIGQTVSLNGKTYIVTGVMPPGFSFPGRTDVWIPPMIDWQITGMAFAPNMVARLAPGVSLEQARQTATAYDQSRRPPGASPGQGIELRPLGGELTSRVRPTLLLLAASTALLLLAVCASVANLLLARVSARTQELRVRRALGASRWRIARQISIECLALSGAGAVLGVLVAVWALQVLRVLAPSSLDSSGLGAIDVRFAATAIGVTVLTAIAFGLAPGLAATAHEAEEVVRAGRHDVRTPFWRRLRSALIVGQMAVALVLLTAGAAAVAALLALTRIDPGFGNVRAVGMTVTLPLARFQKEETIAAFFERAHERLSAAPGVRRVGATGFLPGGRETGVALDLTVPSRPRPSGAPRFHVSFLSASEDYFRVMGIRLIEGRSFTTVDRPGAPPVVVLSETAARGLFPDGTPAVGQRVQMAPDREPTTYDVIGVVADVRLRSLSSSESSLRQAYVPLRQSPPFGILSFVAEVDGRLSDSMASLRGAMRDVDPSIPVYDIKAIDDVVDQYVASHRLAGTLVSGFGIVTLLVAAIGLYGLMAQLVTEQTREIGIRVALGAAPHALRRRIVRHGIAHAALGAALGALGASGALRLFGAVMPGLEFPGAWILVVNAAVLLGAALAATWVPASRVIRVDPAVALHQP